MSSRVHEVHSPGAGKITQSATLQITISNSIRGNSSYCMLGCLNFARALSSSAFLRLAAANELFLLCECKYLCTVFGACVGRCGLFD